MPETNKNNNVSKELVVLSEDERKERIIQLRKLLQDEENLKGLRTDEAYLERFLFGTNFDVEAAFDRMKTFYELLLEYPEWYTKTAPLARKDLIEKDIRIVIPQRDKEGRPVYIVKVGNLDVSKMDMLEVISVDDIWLESVVQENVENAGKGLCVIVDIKNYSWRLIKWLTPEIIRNSIKKLQSLPFRDYRFHIVNKSIPIHAALKLVLPFLPQYIKEMIKFHFDNWDSLYEHIDREVLPPEYGGSTDIDYKNIYEKLYKRNDQILESFVLYRTLDKQ